MKNQFKVIYAIIVLLFVLGQIWAGWLLNHHNWYLLGFLALACLIMRALVRAFAKEGPLLVYLVGGIPGGVLLFLLLSVCLIVKVDQLQNYLECVSVGAVCYTAALMTKATIARQAKANEQALSVAQA